MIGITVTDLLQSNDHKMTDITVMAVRQSSSGLYQSPVVKIQSLWPLKTLMTV